MKKYITLAALLAAGTAANAAIETSLLWGFDFTDSTLKASAGTVTSLSGTGTIDTDGGFTAGVGSYTTNATAGQILKFTLSGDETSAVAKLNGSFTLSFHAKEATNISSWQTIASFGESNSYCFKVDTNGTSDNGLGFNADGDYGVNSHSAIVPTESWQHYVVTYQGNKSNGGTLILYIDGTQAVSYNFTTGNDNQMKMFSFGGRLGNNNNNSAMVFSDIAIYDGVLAKDQIEYLKTHKANASAIPEPSAFGMLAGLGALALVASRRRRK